MKSKCLLHFPNEIPVGIRSSTETQTRAAFFTDWSLWITWWKKNVRAAAPGSDIEVLYGQGILFDELAPWFDLIAHQGGKDLIGADHVFDIHP